MNFTSFITIYLISVPIFFISDMIWLAVVAKDFYRVRLDGLMGDVNWFVAVIFYLVFLVGLTFFATYPAILKESIYQALILGALFGFFSYATYDLTNLSTLRGWSTSLSIVDMIWGTVLGGLVSSVVYYIYTHIF
jgi:uncharacterized membrane protein